MSDRDELRKTDTGGPNAAPHSIAPADLAGADMPAPPLPEPEKSLISKGIGLLLIALLFFTLMDVAAKKLGQSYAPAMVIWARFAVNLALVSLIFRGSFLKHARSRQPGLQLLRGAFQMATVALFFLAIRSIGLAEAAALTDLNPVLITLGAALFLGEKIGPRRVAGIFVSFLGALIILRPGAGVMDPAALFALAAAFTYAGGALMTRVVRHDSTATSVIWSAGVGTALSSLALPFFWQEVAPVDLPLFIAVGALGAAGQAALIVAFRHAPAGVLAPYGYLGLVLSSLWGWIFFAQLPDLYTVAGAAVIVLAGIWVWNAERRAALNAAAR